MVLCFLHSECNENYRTKYQNSRLGNKYDCKRFVTERSPSEMGNYGCCILGLLCPSKYSSRFLWAAEEKKMEQTEKIALLAGRIIRLEKSAARLSKDLSAVVKELAEISEQLTSHQSPFGVVYPLPEIHE